MKGRISKELRAALRDPNTRGQVIRLLLNGESGRIQIGKDTYLLYPDRERPPSRRPAKVQPWYAKIVRFFWPTWLKLDKRI